MWELKSFFCRSNLQKYWKYLYELFETILVLYPDSHLAPEGEDQAPGSWLGHSAEYRQIRTEQLLFSWGSESRGWQRRVEYAQGKKVLSSPSLRKKLVSSLLYDLSFFPYKTSEHSWRRIDLRFLLGPWLAFNCAYLGLPQGHCVGSEVRASINFPWQRATK